MHSQSSSGNVAASQLSGSLIPQYHDNYSWPRTRLSDIGGVSTKTFQLVNSLEAMGVNDAPAPDRVPSGKRSGGLMVFGEGGGRQMLVDFFRLPHVPS